VEGIRVREPMLVQILASGMSVDTVWEANLRKSHRTRHVHQAGGLALEEKDDVADIESGPGKMLGHEASVRMCTAVYLSRYLPKVPVQYILCACSSNALLQGRLEFVHLCVAWRGIAWRAPHRKPALQVHRPDCPMDMSSRCSLRDLVKFQQLISSYVYCLLQVSLQS
jgi:hypothetical protein